MTGEYNAGEYTGAASVSEESRQVVRFASVLAEGGVDETSVPVWLAEREHQFGITHGREVIYARPQIDNCRNAQLYSVPLLLDAFPYDNLRRWIINYNLDASHSVVQDWITNSRPDRSGAWLAKTVIDKQRGIDSPPTLERAQQKLHVRAGRRYEQEMPAFLRLAMTNDACLHDLFMDMTQPFAAGRRADLTGTLGKRVTTALYSAPATC